MLRNYLITAFRALWRDKINSSINIVGLGLGVLCCILISLYVYDERTFDHFHAKADRIFRVYVKEDWGENQQFFNASTPFPMGPVLKENFPEVEGQVRILSFTALVKIGDQVISEQVTIGGEDFFQVFDFPFSGDRSKALSSQGNVVLSEVMARKFFGTSDPINKTLAIRIGERFEEFIVSGISSSPTNSSISFEVLISDLNLSRMYDQQFLTSSWFNVNPETYVLLQEGSTAESVMAKFPALFRTLIGEEDFTKSKYFVGLQPIKDIHLNTEFPAAIAPVSDGKYSLILAAIALVILFVACINFVTLSLGRSLRRAKEVGIRKVVGAQRSQIITQFIGEALVITVISIVLGVLAARMLLPQFNDLAGKQLEFPFSVFLVLVVLVLLMIMGVITGSYPALVLSGFRPILILKGSLPRTKQGFRRALVGIQLVLSIFLITSTLVMRQQLNFLQSKNLGFNKEQVAVMRISGPRAQLAERVKNAFITGEQFKSSLLAYPEVESVCISSHDFGTGNWVAVGFTDESGVYRNMSMNVIDDDYIPSMKMTLVAGRNFSDQTPSDVRRSVIVNEAFVKEYGWADPIGKRIPGKNFPDHEIIGVVQDFHFTSLYTKVGPLVMVQDPSIIMAGVQNISIDASPVPKLMVRLKAGQIAGGIARLEETWKKMNGEEEFVFSFVDEALNRQYRSDQNLGRIVTIATVLAVIIGSLGLYALASLAMQSRVKEIGIRKVMGATERSLLGLLSKDYVLLVLISVVLSIPLTLLAMRDWLSSFEYRITLGWGVFALAGGISLAIALVTISWQTLRTASAQPADTLKYE
ncbi:MAG: ABC transporter permease [Cyclobacteriaceae bacterium]|nr:ABC transporter permease [Cyclobacteriaceae bacterium]